MSRIICLSELPRILLQRSFVVIVLVAETHFGLRREFTLEWINEPFDKPKKWLVKWGASYDSMKRWPYWRFYWTVKKKKTKIRLKLNVLWSDIVFLKKSLTFCSRKFKICEIKMLRKVSIEHVALPVKSDLGKSWAQTVSWHIVTDWIFRDITTRVQKRFILRS